MVDDLTALASHQLKALHPDKRIVILHPHFTQYHALLGDVLQQERAAYVRVDDTWTTLDAAAAAIRTEADQYLESPLNGQGLHWLVLDEFDRLPAKLLVTVVREALKIIGAGRLVLIGRELPHLLLKEDSLRALCAFIPHDPGLMMMDYAQPAKAPLLEVYALGKGQVVLNGRRIDNWDGVLPRLLFFYLIDRGMATRGNIFATFWPQLTSREATNVFHVTKRKINEIFGMDFTVYWSGYYRISPDIQLSYDTVRFAQLCQNGEIAPPAEAEQLLTQAVGLYRGGFLVSNHAPWIDTRREELKQTYAEALTMLAKLKTDRGLLREGLGLYLRALAIDMSEEVAVNVMQIYSELGKPEDALAIYQRLEQHKNTRAITPQVSALAEVLRAQSA